MIHSSAMNLSPLLNVALMGVMVAIGPLSWVWMRSRGSLEQLRSLNLAPTTPEQGGGELVERLSRLAQDKRLLMLAQITLFLTFDLLLFGAFTRLSDSGLGCPDWPGCYGFTSPEGAKDMIANAQSLMPTGPVTHLKAWIEMLHRYLATAVGVLILTICIFTSVGARPKYLKWMSLAILAWVCLQGAFGALTVTMRLYPAVVTMHLLGAIILLMLLTHFVIVLRRLLGAGLQEIQELIPSHDPLTDLMSKALRLRMQASGEENKNLPHSQGARPGLSSLRILLRVGLCSALMQIVLGGWVSTNYAVMACSSFPMCQNSWWPEMSFEKGFEIFRALGLQSNEQILPFEALTAIHYTHRLFAYWVIVCLLFLGVQMRKDDRLHGLGSWVLGLITLQAATGVANVVFGWPLLAAVMHTGGAAALVVVITLGIQMLAQEGDLNHGLGVLQRGQLS
jgi:heme a synthase